MPENDLISRSALLEESEYFSCYNPDCEDTECEFSFVYTVDVRNAPAVDAVEVVRCRDCKHYMTIFCTCDGCCISDDWFCADGERRAGDALSELLK